MTPKERRAKYPLASVTPMSDDEGDVYRSSSRRWIEQPSFTSSQMDQHYQIVARLVATIDECRTKYLLDIVE